MKDGERGRPIENYGEKEQKQWLDNTLPDPHPCTAGNKEEEHSQYSAWQTILLLESFESCLTLYITMTVTIGFYFF